MTPEELLNGPCQMHYYIDSEGRRQSNHLLKDCRTWRALQKATSATQVEAVNRGFVNGPRSEVHLPPPPPPPPAFPNSNQQNVLQITGPSNTNGGYTQSKGALQMIQKARPTNRAQKLITRQVNMAVLAPPPTVEYLNWSDQPIGFDRVDHPPQVPRPGHSALVIPAQIAGYDIPRVFVDGGSSINLIFANTLTKMHISLSNLAPTETRFHGITPEKPNYPLGKIALDVQFGSAENFRKEKIEFEVMDWPSQYHAILGRPAYARFMAVPHYAYLLWRMPGPKGPITIRGSFTLSDKCDRDFNKISESFGMQAKFEAAKFTTNHDVLPEGGRSLHEQAFDTSKDSKEVQVHPTDDRSNLVGFKCRGSPQGSSYLWNDF
jgi:hypothetical protein